MQEILLMQKPMVKEFIYFPTDPFMKVIFLILSFKAMEVWYTQIVESDMMETFNMDFPKAKVSRLITTVVLTKVNFIKVKNKDMVFMNGQMDTHMKEVFLKV